MHSRSPEASAHPNVESDGADMARGGCRPNIGQHETASRQVGDRKLRRVPVIEASGDSSAAQCLIRTRTTGTIPTDDGCDDHDRNATTPATPTNQCLQALHIMYHRFVYFLSFPPPS